MKNYLLLFAISLSCLTYFPVKAQTANPNAAFVIDSIPVIDDPEKGDELLNEDISDMTIVKNKDSLRLLGYEKLDMVTFIFTKAYRARPDSLKRIPSTKSMKREGGVWYYNGSPYTGRIINYYYSGRKQADAWLTNGKVDGTDVFYYQNGHISLQREYRDGISNGMDREYYQDGSLHQEGRFSNGKEEGGWKDYYPNGQVKQSSNFKAGVLMDSAAKYYSNGRVKERLLIKNGKVVADPSLAKIQQLMAKSQERNQEGDTKGAIEYATKVIRIDENYADAYYTRGTILLNEMRFDEAIADLDKALAIEPYMENALGNRAFARIRKYQYAGSRLLSKGNDVEVRTAKDKPDIPPAEKAIICDDLTKAILYGDRSDVINQGLTDFCQLNWARL